MTDRIKFFCAFLFLVIVEVLIALFVNDRVIRPYIGDVIVVVVIYCFIRTLVPEKVPMLSLYIFVFSALVEVAQYYNIVHFLGFGDNAFMSVLIGTSFSWLDILCYAVGCACTGFWEYKMRSGDRKSGRS